MSKIILQGDQIISYDLTRKKVKNINIRVKSDLTVQVSAPSRISQSEIEKILMEKSDFILSALQKYEQRLEAAEALAKDGNGNEYVTILGTLFPIRVISGKKNKAEICENEVLVTLKDINDIPSRKKAIDLSLDALLRDTVEELCRQVYPKFEDHLSSFPKIKFRRMKSRWGSCNYKNNILTFNYHLIHAPLSCVEYVVCHEFTHFIHPDHSKAFYLELSKHVPDYKDKKKLLNSVIIN